MIMAQMEAVKRQEEELERREREIYERMQMVERGFFAQTGGGDGGGGPSVQYMDEQPVLRDQYHMGRGFQSRY
jgi:hypothetical protein